MPNILYHEEIDGGHTIDRHIILNATDFRDTGGYIEVAASDGDGDDLETARFQDEAEAKAKFDKLVQKYAYSFQEIMYFARLIPGHKYTLVYFNESGFPVVQKITFDSMRLTTYEQYSDAVQMIFRPFRKRTKYIKRFRDSSMMIFNGWQEIDEDAAYEVMKETAEYSCFPASLFESYEKSFKNPVMIYKVYKPGKNGQTYA